MKIEADGKITLGEGSDLLEEWETSTKAWAADRFKPHELTYMDKNISGKWTEIHFRCAQVSRQETSISL